jgi:hypothetical protein
MAVALECLSYNIVIYKESLDTNTLITSVYPTAQWRYYIQYTDCCTGTSLTRELSTIAGWDPSGLYDIFSFPGFKNWGVPPVLYVQRISDGLINTIKKFDVPNDGWSSIEQAGGVVIPNCPTTTTSTTTIVSTTTKSPINVVFKSCCGDAYTYSSVLNYQFWQRVICLKSPIDSVYRLTATSSILINQGSWTTYFQSETVTNPGPSCSCDCATQSLNCSKIKVESAVRKTFRYIDCNTGLVKEQLLQPGRFDVSQDPTLIGVPSTCAVAITNTDTTVNVNYSQATTRNGNFISYSGPYGWLMGSNSEYHVPVTGTYLFDMGLYFTARTAGNSATNSVTLNLKRRQTNNTVTTLLTNSWLSRYTDEGSYGYTISIGGTGSFSLLSGDKIYLTVSKSTQLISATYTSMICTSGQNLTQTSTGMSPATYNIVKDWTNPQGIAGPLKLSFTSPSSANWSGTDYTAPYSLRGYTFSWSLSGTFTVNSSVNVSKFSILLSPMGEKNMYAVYSSQEFSGVSSGTFNFVETFYAQDFYPGELANLCIFVRIEDVPQPLFTSSLSISLSLDNGSVFRISSEPDFIGESKSFTYFEVVDGPTYNTQTSSYGFTFCVRTPLQNQPPIQSIGLPGTFSACQTPGPGLYFPACSPALSMGDCTTWVRESAEISGTQCIWPSNPSQSTTLEPQQGHVVVETTTQALTIDSSPLPQPTTPCVNTCTEWAVVNNSNSVNMLVNYTSCVGIGTVYYLLSPMASINICHCGNLTSANFEPSGNALYSMVGVCNEGGTPGGGGGS